MYRLFGAGRLQDRVRTALEAEHILLLDEGIGGSVTYRDYRAPGKRIGLRRVWFTGSIVVTEKRIVAFAFGRTVINLTLDHPNLGKVNVQVEPGSVLCVGLDAQDFHPEQAGRIEYRFRVEKAEEFADCFTVAARSGEARNQAHERCAPAEK